LRAWANARQTLFWILACQLDHTFCSGVECYAQYSGASFFRLHRDIDASTGLVTASYDASGNLHSWNGASYDYLQFSDRPNHGPSATTCRSGQSGEVAGPGGCGGSLDPDRLLRAGAARAFAGYLPAGRSAVTFRAPGA
jgi:hypothetical protein